MHQKIMEEGSHEGRLQRVTFDLTRHDSGVLDEQGRVTLDADANEQVAILLHYVRTLGSDLLGPHAAPVGGGFEWRPMRMDSTSPGGTADVDGILVENDADDWSYTEQKDYPCRSTIRSRNRSESTRGRLSGST